jgi:hypothetical protein
MSLLTRDERRALIDYLLRLPNSGDAAVRRLLLADLPGNLRDSVEFAAAPAVHIANIITMIDSDAWAVLPDGARPLFTVIENAADMVRGARLESELRGLLGMLRARADGKRAPTPPLQTPEADAPTAVPTTSPATQDDFRYDAFISYSSKDKAWVRGTLLPSLERAGLRVCIDYRDFELGVPSLVNIESAIQQSRKTLLVLTPNWVASQWTDFEGLLVQTLDPAAQRRRILPLLVEPCEIPIRLKLLTYLDLTDPADREAQMPRLIASIRATPAGLGP